GSVYLLVGGAVDGDATGVIRYTPGSADKNSRRVTLTVPVGQAEAGGHGDSVYPMGGGGSLVAVDMAAGRATWPRDEGLGPVGQAEAGVHGDTVYLMGGGGALVAVDMAAGRELWRLETGVSRGSRPVADGRHVYVTAPDGRLLGVDARTGKLLGQTRPRLGD